MISCKLKGGLGNQMFQIATTQALAWENGVETAYPQSITPNQGSYSNTYDKTVYKELSLCKSVTNQSKIYKEVAFTHKPIPFVDGMLLDGYYQSPKYFNKYKKQIQDLFINQAIVDKLEEKYSCNFKNCVSLHIRRGDYIDNPNLLVLPIMYYNEALQKVLPFENMLVFSDDINWCKNTIKDNNAIFIEGLEDYEDLYLMSLCRMNIISNSSFSWWASYLNLNEDKVIIAPKQWFTAESGISSGDIYTEEMILI